MGVILAWERRGFDSLALAWLLGGVRSGGLGGGFALGGVC